MSEHCFRPANSALKDVPMYRAPHDDSERSSQLSRTQMNLSGDLRERQLFREMSLDEILGPVDPLSASSPAYFT